MKKLLFIVLLICTKQINAQVANDNCSGAISLGTLGTPPVCGAGIENGITDTLSATTVGATPDSPYLTEGPCGGGGTMASPANDIWYSFTMPGNSFGVNIVISNAGFTPNIALWEGSCSNLIGVGCTVGTAGSATLNLTGLDSAQTYLMQLSGNTGETGAFKMSINAFENCAGCMVGSTYTVNPLPINNMYGPNQTVNFCYHISKWEQVDINWFHGLTMVFGSGWNMATLTTTPPASCDGEGTWAYYPSGETSCASGVAFPAGFYYTSTLGASICAAGPGNTFGDNCSGDIAVGTWNFCFSIATNSTLNSASNLNVTFGTSGDGESGSWSSTGCLGDLPVILHFLPDTTNNTTGITTLTGNTKNGIYPNPNNGNFVIEPNSTTKQTMQVYDVNGKLVLAQTISGKTSIDATILNEGVYNISLQSNEGMINKRLVIVK